MPSSCTGVAVKNLAATAIKFPSQVCINVIYILILCTYKLYRPRAFVISQILCMWEISFTHKNFLLGVKFLKLFCRANVVSKGVQTAGTREPNRAKEGYRTQEVGRKRVLDSRL